MMNTLLDKGADVNAYDKYKRSALWWSLYDTPNPKNKAVIERILHMRELLSLTADMASSTRARPGELA